MLLRWACAKCVSEMRLTQELESARDAARAAKDESSQVRAELDSATKEHAEERARMIEHAEMLEERLSAMESAKARADETVASESSKALALESERDDARRERDSALGRPPHAAALGPRTPTAARPQAAASRRC